MSGSTIGGIVGGVIGAYFGNPQLGFLIGSAIGGAVSPDVIKAPSIGDAQKQTGQAGVPRPVVFGHPAPFAGNIIDGEAKARKVIKKVRQGKGGGPIVKEEHFLLTTAIRICEGPIAGVLRIWRNGEVVYDRRAAADMPVYSGAGVGDAVRYVAALQAKSASFASKVRIYLGTETQLPDPSLEAIHGVGNTPYYRGTAYIVIADDDVTDTRGAAAQYQFEVVAVGTETPSGLDSGLSPGRQARFVDAAWPLADPESDYEFEGTLGTRGGGGGTLTYTGTSVADVIAHFTVYDYSAVGGGSRAPSHYLGYSATTSAITTPSIGIGISTYGYSGAVTQPSVVNNAALILVYNDLTPNAAHDTVGFSGYCAVSATHVEADRRGAVAMKYASDPGGQFGLFESCSPNSLYGTYPLCIRVTPKRIAPLSVPPPGSLAIPDAPGHYVAPDGTVARAPVYTPVSGSYKVLATAATGTVDSRMQYTNYELGPVLASTDPNYTTQAFWDAAYAAAVSAGTMPAGYLYSSSGVDTGARYPKLIDPVYRGNAGSALNTLKGDDVTLQYVADSIASRCNVPASRIDTAALAADVIPGLLVATQATGADCLRPTQQMFFYDLPEVDGRLVAVKRGGAAVATITDDVMLELGTEEKATRPQQIEYPGKVSVVTQDPAAEYSPIPQTSIRTSPNITATSEVTIQSPIPFKASEAKRRADIIHKVMFAMAEGRRDFALPEEYSRLVPSDTIVYNGKRWLVEQKDSTDGENRFKCVYDRASAYASAAIGNAPRPPVLPTTGLRGPTVMVAMNLAPLRTQDNTPGMYIAAHGVLPGWAGCLVELSVDGGQTFQGVQEINGAARMGALKAPITAADSAVSVSVYGELESVTPAQIAARANAFALIGAVTEVGQFQTATLTAVAARSDYDLTGITRGRLGTTAAAHAAGEQFVLLDAAVYFVPIDVIHAGKLLIFRAVTLGTAAENNPTFSVVYNPQLLAPPSFEYYTNSLGNRYTDAAGAYYFKEI